MVALIGALPNMGLASAATPKRRSVNGVFAGGFALATDRRF
jgi:hypothetical protein